MVLLKMLVHAIDSTLMLAADKNIIGREISKYSYIYSKYAALASLSSILYYNKKEIASSLGLE